MPGCCLPYFELQGHMKIQMTTTLDVFLKFCSWALLAVSSNGTPHYSHAALALEGEISSCAGSDEIGTTDGDEPGCLMLKMPLRASALSSAHTTDLHLCHSPYSRTASPLHQLGHYAAKDNL